MRVKLYALGVAAALLVLSSAADSYAANEGSAEQNPKVAYNAMPNVDNKAELRKWIKKQKPAAGHKASRVTRTNYWEQTVVRKGRRRPTNSM